MSQMLININREILKLETMLQSSVLEAEEPEVRQAEEPKVRLGTTISGNATGTVVELRASHTKYSVNKIQLIVFIPGVGNDEAKIREEITKSMSKIIWLLKESTKGDFSEQTLVEFYRKFGVETLDEFKKRFGGQTPHEFYSTFDELFPDGVIELFPDGLILSDTFTVNGLKNDIDGMLVSCISRYYDYED